MVYIETIWSPGVSGGKPSTCELCVWPSVIGEKDEIRPRVQR